MEHMEEIVDRYLADAEIDTGPLTDEDGFLSLAWWTRSSEGGTIQRASEALASARGAAILGEPGSGKTTLLDSLPPRDGEHVHRLDLGATKDPEGRLRAIVDGIRESEYPQLLVIDTLDEAGVDIGVLALAAREALRECGADLRIIIACRAAEWASAWTETLSAVTGESMIFSLLPLTRDDARLIAIASGLAKGAADALVSSAGPFAAIPLLLNMMIRDYEARIGDPDINALYDRQIDRLIAEHHPAKSVPARTQVDPAAAQSLARTICAAMVLTGAPGIRHQGDGEGLAPSEIATLTDQTQDDVRHVARTALFRATPDGAVRPTHRSFAEYLSAEFLIMAGLSADRVLKILSDGSGSVAPQLRGVLRWLVVKDAASYGSLIIANPMAALDQALPMPPDVSKAVVDGLVQAARGPHLRDYRFGDAAGLGHPGLGAQLRPVLTDAGEPEPVVRLALRIMRETASVELLPEAVALAVETSRPIVERQLAAYFIADVGQEEHRRQLLAVLKETTSETEELRGTALRAGLDLLPLEELLTKLRITQKVIGGAMSQVLLELPDRSTRDDLPTLIRFATEALMTWEDEYDAAGLLSALMRRGLTENPVAEQTVKACAEAIATLDASRRHSLETIPNAGLPFAEIDTSVRQGVLRALADIDIDGDGRIPLELARVVRGLGQSDDLMFWCDLYEDESDDSRRTAIGAVVHWLVDGNRADHREFILEETSHPQVRSAILTPHFVEPRAVDDGPEWMRKHHAREAERLRARDKRHQALFEVLNGDELIWINAYLVLSELSGPGLLSVDLFSAQVWAGLTQSDQQRLTALAIDFVREGELPDTGFVESGTWSVSHVAVTAAIVLLRRQGEDLSDLPAQRVEALAPFVIAGPWDHDDDEIRTTLSEWAGDAAPDAVNDVLVGLLDSGRDTRTHAVLPALNSGLWTTQRESLLLDRARAVEERQPWRELMSALTSRGVPGAEDELSRVAALDHDPRQFTAAGLLLRHNPQRALGEVLDVVNTPEAADDVVALLDGRGGWPGLADATFEVADEVARWAVQRFPTANDRPIGQGYNGHDPRDLRRAAVQRLADFDDPRAVQALRALADLNPHGDWDYYARADATAERLAQQSWKPLRLDELVRLLQEPGSRPVRSPQELLEVVVAGLLDFDSWLRAGSRTRGLWDEIDVRRPKSEDDLSDRIRDHLQTFLSGVVVNREVEVRRKGRGMGERTDLLITAPAPPTGANARDIQVVIEVKGAWNDGVLTAMDDQLAQGYLSEIGGTHGAYVVGWFGLDEWTDPKDSRRTKTSRFTKAGLTDEVTTLTAAAAGRHGVHLAAVIIDCSWPGESE